jgi:hypothetical protein
MQTKTILVVSGLAALVCLGPSALAQSQRPQAQANQPAAPSHLPGSQANTAAVSGADQLPAPPAVGRQPAAPSSAPASEATTKAEVSRQSETPK